MIVLSSTPRHINHLSAKPAAAKHDTAIADSFVSGGDRMMERERLRKLDKAGVFLFNTAIATLPGLGLGMAFEKLGLASAGPAYITVATFAAGLALAAHHATKEGDEAMLPSVPTAMVGVAGAVASTANFAPGLTAALCGGMALAGGVVYAILGSAPEGVAE
jgi:hypothetical protein